jgi:hypothetical protein
MTIFFEYLSSDLLNLTTYNINATQNMSATQMAELSKQNEKKNPANLTYAERMRQWDEHVYQKTLQTIRRCANMGYENTGNDITWKLSDRVKARLRANGYRVDKATNQVGFQDWEYFIYWGRDKQAKDAEEEQERQERKARREQRERERQEWEKKASGWDAKNCCIAGLIRFCCT